MAIQNNSSLNPSTKPKRRRKTQSENPRPRWECEAVQLIASQVESKEWRYALESVASELYDLSHQLRDVGQVVQTRLNENTLSPSLRHPDEIETPTPATTVVGEDGVWNGKEPYQPAA